MTVVNLGLRNAQKQHPLPQSRIVELFTGMPSFPQNVEGDPRTGIARFSDSDWAEITDFFDCFCVTVPPTARFESILAAWSHLWEKYGQIIDVKVRGTVSFASWTRKWTAEQHAFLDALIEGSPAKIRTLGTRLGFFEEVHDILNSRTVVNPRGPVIQPVCAVDTPIATGTPAGRPKARKQSARAMGKPALRLV